MHKPLYCIFFIEPILTTLNTQFFDLSGFLSTLRSLEIRAKIAQH